MKKALLIIGALVVVGVIGLGMLLFGFLFYVGSSGPEIFVVTGQQMTKSQVKTIDDLGILNEGEEIKYFYSDAVTDIRSGMYFLTDTRVVLYNDSWAVPSQSCTYDEIEHTVIVYSDNFFDDSQVTIELKDGDVMAFPVSGEKDMDEVFYTYLQKKAGLLEE